ncbi:MAG: SDR family NAD(P)-dependent oxidoreductase, partial [Ilumatobacteraceae bacterium]|nr:SDR family NAD(P)-dependent oxidoreductase [Ilumatobacteraceae bacterium]
MATPDNAALIDLSGKNALVTGAAKGIGRAITERLIAAGANVTLADLDASGDATAKEVGGSFVVCDITNADQLSAAVTAAARGGNLDILVNNAGIYPTTGPIDKVSDSFVSR